MNLLVYSHPLHVPSLRILFCLLQVNVGCVPKKVMFNTAVHAEYIEDHRDYGFDVEMKGFDWRLERLIVTHCKQTV